ncbi:hypothetical protein HWV62_15647 [Athelia sp. TMB]|nr:hypothetical protein HWV62_15647 [Athelia sp. TMB]
MSPRQCVCGFTASLDNAFRNHQRTCKKAKKQLASVLERNTASKKENQARVAEERKRAELLEAHELESVVFPDQIADPLTTGVHKVLNTPRNIFGLVRRYFADKFPTADPDELVTLAELSEPVNPLPASYQEPTIDDSAASFAPYPNKSSFDIGNYYWNGSQQKTQADFKQLMEILSSPGFTVSDLCDTNWSQINAAIGEVLPKDDGHPEWLDEDAGWVKDRINISVPFAKGSDKPGHREYKGVHFYHRKIVDVLKERISNPHAGQHFHMTPYKLHWQPTPEHHEVHVQGEMYTSPAFMEAQAALQNSPPEPGCHLERVVVSLMWWSDVTHLTNFGTAHLWPLYLFLGNDSKYRRCKPSCHLCSHVAYFQTLPDEFKDFANEHIGGKGPKAPFLAHCRREFFHAQLEILLDDEFLEAWVHGIVIMCFDDYPEKCLIPKDRIQNLGMKLDRKQRVTKKRVDDEHMRRTISTSRSFIYEQDLPVNGAAVERLLKPESLVPTSNTFSNHLHQLGFNLFLMFVVDILHEFELGVWKSLFIHLLRMLAFIDIGLIHELDRQFRAMPTFGRDTIRKFKANMSEMKSLAARDFEDLLQCAIPAFDGLFPEPHNGKIMTLLFTYAHWHALAKLRQHHDITLDILDNVTTSLGAQFRYFVEKICPCYDTRELPREAAARECRQKKADQGASGQSHRASEPGPKVRRFHLQRIKHHFLGDYTDCIHYFGTTDSYSPGIGESEHRSSKKAYVRTSRKAFELQLAQIDRRQANLRRISQKIYGVPKQLSDVAANPIGCYTMGFLENHSPKIGVFLAAHEGDPAVKDFRLKLQKHLAPQMNAIILSGNKESYTLEPTSSLDGSITNHSRVFLQGR